MGFDREVEHMLANSVKIETRTYKAIPKETSLSSEGDAIVMKTNK